MPPRIPLTRRLAGRPFRVRDALAEGWSEDRLSGPDLARPFHGVRTAIDADAEHAYAPLLRPGERFSHLSAARLWGAPLPPRAADVHVTLPGGPRARSRGVVGHESTAGEIGIRAGLPVSDPATLFCELAGLLDVPALVAVGDHLVLDPRVLDPHDLRPYLTADALRRAVRSAGGRGIRTARAAVALVRVGAESPMETALRLLACNAGLPEPVLQYELRDGHRLIGWFDLAWPERRLFAEFDGDQHRTSRRQYERDMRRLDAAADAGWRVIRVRAPGILSDPAGTRGRLRRAYGLG